MNKEELKQEYNYWLQTIENTRNSVSDKPKTSEELESYNFAKGFVSAINKSGVLKG